MRFNHGGKTFEGVQLRVFRTADLDVLVVSCRARPDMVFVNTCDGVHEATRREVRLLARRYGLSGLDASAAKSVSAA